MAFSKNIAAAIVSGRTAAFVLDMLPGSPVAHCEHLSDDNATWLSERITNANAVETKKRSGRKVERVTKATVEEDFEATKRILKLHVIRRLEAVHDDGTPATDADIPDWVESLPRDVAYKIFNFASNAECFRTQVLDPEAAKELAKK